MRDDQFRFLSVIRQAPARLTVEQTAWLLNCQPHDVPILVSARLLKPLGSPRPNSVKYFATAEILEAAKERAWLAKLTQTLGLHWQKKNQRKTGEAGLASEEFPGRINLPPAGVN